VDAQNNRALRMALQNTGATYKKRKSDLKYLYSAGTACQYRLQCMPYIMSRRLKRIAQRVAVLTQIVAEGIEARGFQLISQNYFDTITVKVDECKTFSRKSRTTEINLRTLMIPASAFLWMKR